MPPRRHHAEADLFRTFRMWRRLTASSSSATLPLLRRERGERYFQPLPARQNHGVLDDVSQLARIARPGIALEGLQIRPGNACDLLAHPLLEFANEGPDQRRDIPWTLAERGDDDGEDIQAVVEVP